MKDKFKSFNVKENIWLSNFVDIPVYDIVILDDVVNDIKNANEIFLKSKLT